MIEVRVKRHARGLIGEITSEGEESKGLYSVTLQTHDYDFETEAIVEQVLLAIANREGVPYAEAVMQYTVKLTPWDPEDVDLWLTIKDVLKIHLVDKEPDLEAVERIVKFYYHNYYTASVVSGAPQEVIRLYEYDKALVKQ